MAVPNPDRGHRETDEILDSIEARIMREYRTASNEVQKKLEEFLTQFRRDDARNRLLVKKGLLSEGDYRKWLKEAVTTNRYWSDLRNTLAEDYAHANWITSSVVGDALKDVYALNYNYGTYEIENGAGIDTSFSLYDHATVERLLRDDPTILPAPGEETAQKIAEGKLVAWDRRQIQSVMVQSILQGDSIDEIAKRLAETVGESNAKSAVRAARTMTTAAENAGRVDSYKRATNMGIEMEQVWLATLDGKTRHEHRLLDGQRCKVGEKFKVEGESIAYPGDPTAPAHLVYNCRCTLIAAVSGSRISQGLEGIERDSRLGTMSYEEWKHEKEKKRKKEEAETIVAKEIKFGELFHPEAAQFTRDVLSRLNEEWPLSHPLEFVGDVRIHRGYDTDEETSDMHYYHKELAPCAAQYLPNYPGGHCIEIHAERDHLGSIQDDFDELYAIRCEYGDPMKPPKDKDTAFFVVDQSLEGLIMHEYGHAVSESYGVFTAGPDNPFRIWQWKFWQDHQAELSSISLYAMSHPDEMFAEAFVQSHDTRHPDTLAYKLSREIMDAFERYVRGEPL